MLQTNQNQNFSLSVTDSTVYVNQGTGRVGNVILPFRGDSIQFNNMVDFGDTTGKYQYSALLLQQLNAYPDLTAVTSVVADTTMSLTYPTLSVDSSSLALGLFLFNNPDSTVTLMSYEKIN